MLATDYRGGFGFDTFNFCIQNKGMSAEVIAIPRAALHEQVAHRLRQMLVEGRIAPGAKLNERELAEVLHVSRTPLREAIKMLAAEGLVELLPNRGAIAVELSEADLSNYYRINSAIHEAINRAAKNPVLTATYRQVNARLQALRFRSNQDGEKWQRAVKEHERMVDALAARDAAAMRAVLVQHLHHKRDVVVEQLRAAAHAAAKAS
jgi:DNA-binding GntR family transcriptional regulator